MDKLEDRRFPMQASFCDGSHISSWVGGSKRKKMTATRRCSVFFLLCFHLCHADNNPTRSLLRTRPDVAETAPTTIEETTNPNLRGERILPSEALVVSQRERDLSAITECQFATEMKIPLFPANMKYLLHANDNRGGSNVIGQNRLKSAPSNAVLTFCLDRIYLDFHYVLDVGTLVTDLDIECPHLTEPIHFLEPNYVMSVMDTNQERKSRFFTTGKYPGEIRLTNEDILRILVDGENCEFKVRAYHFDDALLIGQLRGDAFKVFH